MVFLYHIESSISEVDIGIIDEYLPTVIIIKKCYFSYNIFDSGLLLAFLISLQYKYQLAIDGTVAPYRMPYLLGGGSLVFKPDSMYFEHFYEDMEPKVHYIPVKADLSDLVDKINWARENDDKAREIAENGQKFANDNLLPKNIFCYHLQLISEVASAIKSSIEILEGMDHVEQKKVQDCQCSNDIIKDEL